MSFSYQYDEKFVVYKLSRNICIYLIVARTRLDKYFLMLQVITVHLYSWKVFMTI